MNEVTYQAEFVPIHKSPMWMKDCIAWLVTVGNVSSYYYQPWQMLPDAHRACKYAIDTCPRCSDLTRSMIKGTAHNGSLLKPPAKDEVIAWLRTNPPTAFRMRQLLGA